MDWQAITDGARAYWVVWLMILFLGIVYWAFRPRNKQRFEKDAEIPLRDDKDGD